MKELLCGYIVTETLNHHLALISEINLVPRVSFLHIGLESKRTSPVRCESKSAHDRGWSENKPIIQAISVAVIAVNKQLCKW